MCLNIRLTELVLGCRGERGTPCGRIYTLFGLTAMARGLLLATRPMRTALIIRQKILLQGLMRQLACLPGFLMITMTKLPFFGNTLWPVIGGPSAGLPLVI